MSLDWDEQLEDTGRRQNKLIHQLSDKVQSLEATVTNPKGNVEKLSPKESPSDAHTVLRGTAPKDSVSIRGTS